MDKLLRQFQDHVKTTADPGARGISSGVVKVSFELIEKHIKLVDSSD